MRILQLIPNLTGGGAEQQMVYLTNELSKRGHDVTVAFLRDGPSAHGLEKSVQLERLRSIGNHDARIASQLVRLIERLRPHVLQSWIPQMDVFGGGACALTRTPWVLREPSTGIAYSRSWKSMLRRLVCRTASAIVSNSSGGDLYWQQHAPNVPRVVIRNGIPLDAVGRAVRVRSEDLDLPSDRPLLVYAGRFTASKNLELLVEALGQLASERAVTMLFCGDGALRERIEGLALSSLGRSAVFLGFVKAEYLWGILKLADGFVFPSKFEGMPNIVAEAMACECPVILSDIAAHRDLADRESAIFVSPADARSVANGIDLLLSRPDDARARAKRARASVERWSISAMADQYEALYERVRR